MTWARAQSKQAKRARIFFRQYTETERKLPVGPLIGTTLLGFAIIAAAITSSAVPVAVTLKALLGFAAIAVLAAACVSGIFIAQRASNRRKLIELAYRLCGEHEPTDDQVAELTALREASEPLPDEVVAQLDRAYCQLIEVIVADGRADPNEMERLHKTEFALMLPETRIEQGRLQGFLDVYDAAIEDEILTEAEQKSLDHIREILEVPERLVKQELSFARQLQHAREARDEDLRALPVSVRLHDGEHVFHTTMATLKRPVARSYDQGVTTVRETVYEPVDSGTAYVTEQRLLLEFGRVLSIPLGHIDEVMIHARHKFLVVIKHGRKQPYYFELSQPYVTLAYLERMLDRSQSAA